MTACSGHPHRVVPAKVVLVAHVEGWLAVRHGVQLEPTVQPTVQLDVASSSSGAAWGGAALVMIMVLM